jgi:hypothetical protein
MVSSVHSQEDLWTKRMILIFSIIISVWLTCIYYPGVMLSDSYSRWNLVNHLIKTGGANKFAIVPALWMALTYGLTKNYASFTLLQSFCFFYSSFLLIQRMGHLKGIWLLFPTTLFFCFPIFQGYSVYQDNAIGTAISINFMLILFLRKEENLSTIKELAYFFIFFLVFSSLLGFRQNNITMLPFVAALVLKSSRIKIIQRWALITAMVFVYSLPVLVEKYRLVRHLDEVNLGFTWETAQIIKRVNDPKYDHYLDFLGKDSNATKNALIDVEEGIMGHLIFKKNTLLIHKVVNPSNSVEIFKRYIKVVFEHPKKFLETRIHSWGRILGISRPIDFWAFQENNGNKLFKYGYRPTILRHYQFVRIHHLTDTWEFLSRPYILFLLSGILMLIGKRYFKEIRYLGTLFTLSIFYYGGFFIFNQSYEFRYFFPAFYLLSVIFLVVLTKSIEVFNDKIKTISNS